MKYHEAWKKIRQLQYESQTELKIINKIQRVKVRLACNLNRHHHCFIYNINDGAIVEEYYKGMVYNFQGTFVMGYYSTDVVNLIKDWRNMEAPCRADSGGLGVLDRIFDTAGVIPLNWV